MSTRISDLIKSMKKGSNIYFKIEPGETKIVRPVPPYEEKYEGIARKKGAIFSSKTGILAYTLHYGLPVFDVESQNKEQPLGAYRCLRDLNERCRFCEYFESLPKSDIETIKNHLARTKFSIDLYLPKLKKIQRWGFTSVRAIKGWESIFNANPFVNDEKKGRNVFVTQQGTGFNTSYTFRVSEKKSPFSYEGDLPNILDELNDTRIADPKLIKKVLNTQFGSSPF